MKNPLKKLITVSLVLSVLACTNSTLAIKPHLSKDDYAIVELRRKELHDQMIEYIPTANEDHNKNPISKLINRFKDHAETENELEEEKLEQAYASYLGPVGCDHINACLRGDLFIDWYPYEDTQDVVSGEKLGPWGTSLCVNPDEALLIMRKALRLKKDTNNSELCEMVLYRGVCLPRVLNSVENNNPTNRQFLENALAKINAGTCAEESFSGKNIIYQAKDLSSTSKSKEYAKKYAYRTYAQSQLTPILLEINIKKGTAFGKDIGDPITKEVILKPNQKIQINSATKEDPYIILHCETV